MDTVIRVADMAIEVDMVVNIMGMMTSFIAEWL